MSTVDDVRAADKRVQAALEAFKKLDPEDAESLRVELQRATDEYAKAIRELE